MPGLGVSSSTRKDDNQPNQALRPPRLFLSWFVRNCDKKAGCIRRRCVRGRGVLPLEQGPRRTLLERDRAVRGPVQAEERCFADVSFAHRHLRHGTRRGRGHRQRAKHRCEMAVEPPRIDPPAKSNRSQPPRRRIIAHPRRFPAQFPLAAATFILLEYSRCTANRRNTC